MTTRTHGIFKSRAPCLISTLSLSLVGFILALALSGCAETKPKFNAMDVTGAEWGKGFQLPDLTGKPVTSKDFPGKVTLVFFGFMYCPDACPTHLTKMQAVREQLGKEGDRLQLVFITLDPERDTPEKLKQYLESFDKTIVGLRAGPEETQTIAKDFRVFYKKVSTKDSAKDPMAYTIDHTTFTYAFDGKGALRLVIPHDLAVEKIATDLRNLLNR